MKIEGAKGDKWKKIEDNWENKRKQNVSKEIDTEKWWEWKKN